jgi:chitinase
MPLLRIVAGTGLVSSTKCTPCPLQSKSDRPHREKPPAWRSGNCGPSHKVLRKFLAPGSLTNKYGYNPWYDSARVGATLYNPSTGIFYTYDDSAAVAAKTAYIKKKKLGGAYVWALNDDDASASLTKTIAAGLK